MTREVKTKKLSEKLNQTHDSRNTFQSLKVREQELFFAEYMKLFSF